MDRRGFFKRLVGGLACVAFTPWRWGAHEKLDVATFFPPEDAARMAAAVDPNRPLIFEKIRGKQLFYGNYGEMQIHRRLKRSEPIPVAPAQHRLPWCREALVDEDYLLSRHEQTSREIYREHNRLRAAEIAARVRVMRQESSHRAFQDIAPPLPLSPHRGPV